MILKAFGTGDAQGFSFFLGTPSQFPLSFISSVKASSFAGTSRDPGCTTTTKTQEFVTTDGKISTTQGTIYVPFQLGGDHTTIINETFHILGEEDLKDCDAILSMSLVERMGEKYGSEAVSCAASDIQAMTSFQKLSPSKV